MELSDNYSDGYDNDAIGTYDHLPEDDLFLDKPNRKMSVKKVRVKSKKKLTKAEKAQVKETIA